MARVRGESRCQERSREWLRESERVRETECVRERERESGRPCPCGGCSRVTVLELTGLGQELTGLGLNNIQVPAASKPAPGAGPVVVIPPYSRANLSQTSQILAVA